MDEKIIILQEQLKKLTAQKDKLLKEVDELELQSQEKDRLYARYLPLIIDVVAQGGDTPFNKACKEISAGLKKGASGPKMAYVFEQLKTSHDSGRYRACFHKEEKRHVCRVKKISGRLSY